METKWLELTRNQTLNNTDKDQEDFSLRFEQQDTPFAFSALPFKAEELEQHYFQSTDSLFILRETS